MELLRNQFINSSKKGLNQDKEGYIRFKPNTDENIEKIILNRESLKQRQRSDDDTDYAKEKLSNMVILFINEDLDFTNEQRDQLTEKFNKALNLAMKIHADQKPRPDGPYVNHILRVSIRIIEEYGIKDLDIVISALLHDSVEDQSEQLVNLADNDENISEREKALVFINDNFGERVKNIVLKLTNLEHEDKNISPDQKNKVYLEHVKEAIQDPDVLPIKLSDFSDNALNLGAIKDISKRFKLSLKYLPVIEAFIGRLKDPNNIFSENKTSELINLLKRKTVEISDFIEAEKVL